MSNVRFTINYESRQKSRVHSFLKQYQAEIGSELKALKIEQYWKMEHQFQAQFFVSLYALDKEQKVYKVLKLANQLWSTGYLNWTVNGPHENQTLIFECILNNTNDDQPLKWAHLQLEAE
ncbi:MAG: hypothetical protein ACFB10_16895 [Salibacteraceae bacterium]